MSSSISSGHPPCTKDRPAHDPGDDDADCDGPRLRYKERCRIWTSGASSAPTSEGLWEPAWFQMGGSKADY